MPTTSKLPMAKRDSKSQPTWNDVKAKLAAFDRPALLDLVHHLYAAHKDNQAFLHARFDLGEDVLEPHKKTIDRSTGNIESLRSLKRPFGVLCKQC